jgi:lipid A 3-O-deacylase
MIRNFALVPALAWACSAAAADGLWTWERKWAFGEDWRLGGYMEFSTGGWRGTEQVTTLAALPVFRIERSYSAVVPYVEGGIGLNLLSQVEAGSGRPSASRLQIGDHVGAGLRFGEQRRHEIGLRLQRLSDGGVARPSPGLSFGVVRYQYNFE